MNDHDLERSSSSSPTGILSETKKAQFSTLPPSTYYIDNVFEMRKSKSSCLLRGQAKDFRNVETFNLNPGYRLSRSAGKIYVSIKTEDPPPIEKPPPRKLSFAEMELLINDLREQVDLLSTLLEEERMRHGGSKKRAVIDLAALERNLRKSFKEQTLRMDEEHEEEKRNLEASYEARMKQMENDLDDKLEKKHTEYRMLQASFKIYQSSVQDEMLDEIKLKRAELEWENKRNIERAVDDCKRKMEDVFSKEREEIRGEFRKNMNELIRGHREELDRIAEKSKFQKNVNELMKRSEQLTITTEELEKTKFELGEASITNRMLNDELQDTKKKLQTLQVQFDSKVRAVEDQHLSLIDSLKQEKADVTRRLVRSCEELQVEKLARESAEKYRQEAAIITLQKQVEALNKRNMENELNELGKKSSDIDAVEGAEKRDSKSRIKRLSTSDDSEISVVRKSALFESNRVSHLITDITTILAGVDSGHLPTALSGMLVSLTESEMRRSQKLAESMLSSDILDHGTDQKRSATFALHRSNSPMDVAGRKRHSKKGSKTRLSRDRTTESKGEKGSVHSKNTSSDSKTALEENRDISGDKQSSQSQAASAYSPHVLSPSESMLSQPANGQAELNAPRSDPKDFYLNDPDSQLKFPDDKESKQLEEQTKTYKDYRHIDFSSDVSFDRKTKLHGLTRAATSPHIEPVASKPNETNTGRWRGTFLARDSYSRPPIIFEVEKYKVLTTKPPDSSKIAKKVKVTQKNVSAIKGRETTKKKSGSSMSNSPFSKSPEP